jgi:hypothetical protein
VGAVLGYAADALWIVALSIMAGASRQAWSRIPAGTPMPLLARRGGAPGLSAPRAVALLLIPGAAFVVGLLLLGVSVQAARTPPGAVILFSARATLAALFALAHLRWLHAALERLGAQGQLRP